MRSRVRRAKLEHVRGAPSNHVSNEGAQDAPRRAAFQPTAHLSTQLAGLEQRHASLRHLASRLGNQALQRLLADRPRYAVQRAGVLEQPAPGEGGLEYGEHGSKGFTDLERIWIDDVMSDPLVALVFRSYGSIPSVILHRVDELGKAHGQYSPGQDELAISDKVYEQDPLNPKYGAELEAQQEKNFKGTLLHEIFHYLEDNTAELKESIPLPKHLMGTLVGPEAGGFGPYAFGWFLHPVTNEYLHFNVEGVMSHSHPRSILGIPYLEEARAKKDWEPSPMAVSGHSISPEEDMAESFSMALVSEESREQFKEAYPKRARLLGSFLARLKGLQTAADAAAPQNR